MEEVIYNEKQTLKEDGIFKRRCFASTENFNRPGKIWKLWESPICVLKKTELLKINVLCYFHAYTHTIL